VQNWKEPEVEHSEVKIEKFLSIFTLPLGTNQRARLVWNERLFHTRM